MTDIDALQNGISLLRSGQREDARALFAASPDDPRALYLHGLSYLSDNEPALALPLLRRARAAGHDHPGVLLNLTRAALGAGQVCEAVTIARTLVEVAPKRAESWLLLGTALNARGRAVDAEPALRRALSLSPGLAPAWLNLGNALADQDQMGEAASKIRAALAIDPNVVEAETSLAYALTALGRTTEAIAACRRATALRPDYARAHWNEGVAHLLAGDWDQGWAKYEWRKRHEMFADAYRDQPRTPEWRGEDVAGKTVLVRAEQGLGDTVMLARYLPLIADRDARAVLACDPSLHRLLAPLTDSVVDRAAPAPAHDVWIDQMSLPRLFGTRPDSVPTPRGYLARSIAARAPHASARIAVVWAGNPSHHNDRRRSIPIDTLAPLFDEPGYSFVSLQQGGLAADCDLPHIPCGDFHDTARALAGVDLLITVDTSIAHLAGAIGTPCWLMLSHAPDWRWMLGRDDTPWYRSLRLFRQTSPGDWDDVVERVIVALDQSVWSPRTSQRNATVNRACPVAAS